jgi:1-aminocyclopropane-1-carboxylate deaminase/D-cysteine desulfhydrase-like pyridoxal-dependent ACC family enzyme
MIPDDIPRVRLIEQPTALQRMARIEASVGHHSLWVKRDDAIPLGQGGNKIRSLEFWLGEAAAQSCDIVLVAGKAVSNACRATAAAAAKLGLDCLILHNDDEPPRNEGNLLLSRLYGASFRFLGPIDEDERAARVEEAAAELRRQGRRPYIIGDSVVGALGYVQAAVELYQQAEDMDLDLRHVLLPGSMGTTEAGFLFGCALLGGPFVVHLVSVEYSLAELRQRVSTIYHGIADRLGRQPGADYLQWTRFHGDYLGEGYDRPTSASLAAIHTFARQEGLLLENTYTSKPAAALLDLVSKDELPHDEPCCLLHTGGIPALFAQADLFQ